MIILFIDVSFIHRAKEKKLRCIATNLDTDPGFIIVEKGYEPVLTGRNMLVTDYFFKGFVS